LKICWKLQNGTKVIEQKKTKSQKLSGEDMHKKLNELSKQLDDTEAERDRVANDRERDKDDFNKKMKEAKSKSDAEIQELKKIIQERDEVIQASTKKIKSMERELEEISAKLATKEVEVLTMELEIEEYRSKLPDLLAKQDNMKERKAQDEKLHKEKMQKEAGSLKDAKSDVEKKNAELQEIAKQKQEIERSVKEAQAKLSELESQIIKKVMSSPSPSEESSHEQNKDKQIDMLKKQLGEEVFERRRLENEIREMKRMCVDMENLKSEKQKLEADVAVKADLENKLNKISIILQGLVNKDDANLTVASIKDVLTKLRKGIATPTSAITPTGTPPLEQRTSSRPKTMTMSVTKS